MRKNECYHKKKKKEGLPLVKIFILPMEKGREFKKKKIKGTKS